jgi:hypothetical protein
VTTEPEELPAPPAPRSWPVRALEWLGVAIVSAPAVWHVALVVVAVAGRVFYPYDLEWNEGGMIMHAARVGHGGIYAPPSVDFVSFPYTPLYPLAIAALGALGPGVSYATARVLSVVAMAAILAVVALTARAGARASWPLATAAALLGAGVYASAYPFVEGWYDIAKPDSFATAIALVGLWLLLRHVRRGTGWRGHAGVAAAAALLALSYFAKQTCIFFVLAGGVVVLAWSWRRVFTYGAVAGLIGLGGTALVNHVTDGRFWYYIYEVKRGQDFNLPRFWNSFRLILGRFPLVTGFLAATLVLVVAAAVLAPRGRKLPEASARFLSWLGIFAVACLTGAIGWAAPWGHYNHFIPALACAGVAIAASVPAVHASYDAIFGERRVAWLPATATFAFAAVVAAQLVHARWQVKPFVPTARDRDAGARLVARLGAFPGDVLMPFHPWYPTLAGKRFYLHRMGILDMSYPHRRTVAGLAESIAAKRFAAIVLDNRDVVAELPGLTRYYEKTGTIPPDERPRVFTGAKVVPDAIWTPRP